MENKEFTYQGKTLNGILMLVLNIIGFLAGVGLFIRVSSSMFQY